MGIAKYIAPSLICLTASTVLATAPANADPAAPSTLQITGTDHDVAYTAALSDDHRAAITTLESGQFRISADTTAVQVTGDDGVDVATVPLAYDIAGRTAEFTAAIDMDGHRLTLRPVAESDTPLRDIDAQQRFFDVLQAHMPAVAAGAAIGAAIGFIAGFPIGLFVVDFITAPLLAVVGGIVGGAIGLQLSGGQPASDDALAYADSVIPGASNVLRPVLDAVPGAQQPIA